MEGNGRVVSREGSFVDRRGREAKARLLRAEATSRPIYQAGEEVGFLQPGSRPGQLQAVASDPPYLTAREIRQYLAGESPDLAPGPLGRHGPQPAQDRPDRDRVDRRRRPPGLGPS